MRYYVPLEKFSGGLRKTFRLGLGRDRPKTYGITARQARTALILVRLWNAQNTGLMYSNNCRRFHARVDITFAARRSVDSLSDGGSSAHTRW